MRSNLNVLSFIAPDLCASLSKAFSVPRRHFSTVVTPGPEEALERRLGQTGNQDTGGCPGAG